MIKKFITTVILNSVLVTTAAIGVSAQTIEVANSRVDIRTQIQAQATSQLDGKESMRTYHEHNARGKKFSTTTKILIGVGIAAAAIGIFVFAASRDKVRTF